MGKPKTQAPVRLSRILVALTTFTTGIGLENINRAEANVVQASPPDDLAEPSLKSFSFGTQQTRPRFCQSDLNTAITSVVNNPSFKTASWGIIIKPVAEPTVIYQHNPNINLIPASNIKLMTTAAAVRIYTENSPGQLMTLRNLLTAVNRYSNNRQANLLLHRIGGKTAAKNALSMLGVNANTYRQVDGSGLSRSNRATPSALVAVLERMYTRSPQFQTQIQPIRQTQPIQPIRPIRLQSTNQIQPIRQTQTIWQTQPIQQQLQQIQPQQIQSERDLFFNSLAIAGVNGTLRDRFRNTPLQGRLFGKTGTLRGVRSLSGYLENPEYGTIVFSVVVNQPRQSGRVLNQAIDRILLKASQVSRC